MATSRSDLSAVLAAGALLVPLALTPALRSVFILPKLAVAVLCAALGALMLIRRGRVRRLSSRIDVPLTAFAAAALLSSLFSIDPHLSWFGHEGEYLFGMGGLASLTAAFYLGAAAGAGGARTFARCSAAAAVLVCLGAFVQASGVGSFAGLWEAPGRRYGSTLGSPVLLGSYLAFVFPLACRLLRERRGDRRLGWACLAAGTAALALSGSRGAWLAAASGVALYYRLARTRRKPRAKISKAWPAVVFLAGASFAAAFHSRGASTAALSDSARVEMWSIALAEFRETPALGSGMDTFIYGFRRRAKIYTAAHAQTQAHNDWLQIMATMGLLGTAAYLWIHCSAFFGVREALEEDPGGWTAALAAAAAAVLIGAKFNSPGFGTAWLAALCAGLLLKDRPRAGRKGARALLPVGLAAAALLWSGVFAARAVAADRQDALGLRARREGHPRAAAVHFEKAVAWDPDNTRYRYDLANNLWSAVDGEPLRRPALRRVVEVAVEGLRRRPLDADIHRLLGLAELRRAEDGAAERLAYARRALEEADRLAPNFLPTLGVFSRVARMQGDEAKRKELQNRIRRIGG